MTCLAWSELTLCLRKQVSFLSYATEKPKQIIRAPAQKRLGASQAGHVQQSMEGAGSLSEELLKSSTDRHQNCAQNSALPRSLGITSCPLTDGWKCFPKGSYLLHTWNCLRAGAEAACAEACGRRYSMSYMGPAVYPLRRITVMSDHSDMVRVYLHAFWYLSLIWAHRRLIQ